MRNILILITLISGLIFTSFIKNETRLLEKKLFKLDNEITSLNFNLVEASLDFEYLSTPKNISFLAENFLDENFSYYKKSINENFSYYNESINENFVSHKKTLVKKPIKQNKNLSSLEKLIKYTTFSQLSIEESVNTNFNVAKKLDNKQPLITEEANNIPILKSKNKLDSKKIKKWVGLQVIKTLLGIPIAPIK